MLERTKDLMDDTILNKIKKQKILLVGVGGVGGFAFESLIRLGFQNITIIDHDKIEESNLNRQIIATKKNIGNLKVEEAKKRGLSINKNCNIEIIPTFLNRENIEEIDIDKYDYIIDACDTITTKYVLIKMAVEKNKKIISCMGTGNRIDPSKITITKLEYTKNDPLAKAVRDIVRKNKLPLNIPVVWSSELPIKNHKKTPASIILVPAAAGLQIAYFILEDLKKTTN